MSGQPGPPLRLREEPAQPWSLAPPLQGSRCPALVVPRPGLTPVCSPGHLLGPGGGPGPSCCILLREEHWGPYLLFKSLNSKAPLVYLSLLLVVLPLPPPPRSCPLRGDVPADGRSPALPGWRSRRDSVRGWSWESREKFISFQMVQMFLPSDHHPPPPPPGPPNPNTWASLPPTRPPGFPASFLLDRTWPWGQIPL